MRTLPKLPKVPHSPPKWWGPLVSLGHFPVTAYKTSWDHACCSRLISVMPLRLSRQPTAYTLTWVPWSFMTHSLHVPFPTPGLSALLGWHRAPYSQRQPVTFRSASLPPAADTWAKSECADRLFQPDLTLGFKNYSSVPTPLGVKMPSIFHGQRVAFVTI